MAAHESEGVTPGTPAEIGAILRTIREVEESLERRSARATGANLMIWGLVSGSIFLFYQLVAWNSGPYAAALGPTLKWVWLVPVALGYVGSALVGARLGSFGADDAARKSYRRGLLPGIIATVLAAILIVMQRGDLIEGALLVVVGTFFVTFSPGKTPTGRACSVAAMVFILSGIGLMLWRGDTASLLAAIVMGGGLIGLGTWFYTSAR